MNSIELTYTFIYVISLYGIAVLNLPILSVKESLERVIRKDINFSELRKTSIQSVALAIEDGAKSKYTAKDILLIKIDRLNNDFYNIIILFLPFLITIGLAYLYSSICFFVISFFHLYFSFDLYRVFSEFIKLKEQKVVNSDKILENIMGIDQKRYLDDKKIDLFLETWVINSIFLILFVAGMVKLC